MARRRWFLTRKRFGTYIYDNADYSTKITVGHDVMDSTRWEVHIFNLTEARKGYPLDRTGISKSRAFAIAREYMRKHPIR